MANKIEQKQSSTPILGYLIVFIIGFVCGIGFAAYKLDSGSTSAPDGHTTEQHAAENASAIENLEAEVTGNPENFKAWVQLGHLYYDSDQFDKAISAYTTSLKYHSGDANLLTDLGTMYRRTQQPEKALEWYKKAKAMDPGHLPSRLNEGIVKYYDLADTEGAIASWEELLRIDPEARSQNGEKIRDFVDHIKADFAKQQADQQ
ncbi:tetratricopeptide repeat protein [Desulfopila sp. IMCC35008]|uniref:tetratricopeptide repeat protein n=1 Tax=Desulfopila sp. IMCC35008 TaxID=2653858 RepID=UPI0013D302C7|nr:tetratricopeptide repeat protein [Desulfopila sp. IMCC35008]